MSLNNRHILSLEDLLNKNDIAFFDVSSFDDKENFLDKLERFVDEGYEIYFPSFSVPDNLGFDENLFDADSLYGNMNRIYRILDSTYSHVDPLRNLDRKELQTVYLSFALAEDGDKVSLITNNEFVKRGCKKINSDSLGTWAYVYTKNGEDSYYFWK